MFTNNQNNYIHNTNVCVRVCARACMRAHMHACTNYRNVYSSILQGYAYTENNNGYQCWKQTYWM